MCSCLILDSRGVECFINAKKNPSLRLSSSLSLNSSLKPDSKFAYE